MKTFEVGKTYKLNGSGQIRIEKRTAHFVTFSGTFSGRKKIDPQSNLLGLGELILIENPDCKQFKYFCFAGNEVPTV